MEHLKIGIVEDDFIIAESIIVALEKIGYNHTNPANTYESALEMLRAESPDLVLLDITLKGKKDGVEVARVINEDYDLPFIFLTSHSDNRTVERAKEVHPSAYLVKPFTEPDLFSSIE